VKNQNFTYFPLDILLATRILPKNLGNSASPRVEMLFSCPTHHSRVYFYACYFAEIIGPS
jgi:hypothetical protein